MPSPQAWSRSGRAAASATPAAMPTEVSSAELTTAGRPTGLHHLERAPYPAERCHLDHHEVGGLLARHAQRVLGLADRLVGGDEHVDPGARQRPPQLASSSTLAHGCSAYSSP